jgi:hypothetical protein
LNGLGESCIFREEAIARVHGGGTARFRGGKNFLGGEITIESGCGADGDRGVGLLDERCPSIGSRIDCDGPYTQSSRCTNDAAGDFTAVRDE